MTRKRRNDDSPPSQERHERGRGGDPRHPPARHGDYGRHDRSPPPPQQYIDAPSSDYQRQRGESQARSHSRYSDRYQPYSSSGHSRARTSEQGRSYTTDAYDRPPKSHKGSSSSRPTETSAQERDSEEIMRRKEDEAPRRELQPLPASGKLRLPLRPEKGTKGARCIVKANHFVAELSDKDVHQYDVSISPEVASRAVNRDVMKQLVKLYRESHLGTRLPAYDGRQKLYSAGPLPFEVKEFTIELGDDEDGSGVARKKRSFKVVIKFAARVALSQLGMFLNGRILDAPQEALQVLDIVLRERPTARDGYFPVGRSFYSPDIGGRNSSLPLGEGLISLRGFYQSIRPTQMGLSLNIDTSSTAFIEALPIVEFVGQLLNRDIKYRTLSSAECLLIKKALKGVQVEVSHRGKARQRYRISGLTSQTTGEIAFPVDEQGTLKSLVDYFRQTYRYTIEQTQLPCLKVGNKERPTYLPMEVCVIVAGQRCSRRLNDKQIAKLLTDTCVRPKEREQRIVETVGQNEYYKDHYAEEFGITLSERMAEVEARILAAPRLKYHDSGREKDCRPQKGQWNMKDKRMVEGGKVSHWMCVNFAHDVSESAARGFCREIARMCDRSGLAFSNEPVLPVVKGRPDQAERVLKETYFDAMDKLRKKDLDLLLVILPDNNGSLYGSVKRICETDLGIVSQCCLKKNVFRKDVQFLANVALKINVKVGGANTALFDATTRRIPIVGDVPTMIFGADVTHPQPGENSSPSIAAVVGSMDWPNISKYMGLVSAQAHREELIQDLYKSWEDPVKGTVHGGMIRELLLEFYKINGRKPHRIVFYRDGVSEGQFYQVLLFELDAIRKACASLEPEGDYQPYVTFIVVQKRHHTRLFAKNHLDRNSVDNSGNILPGTVVDSTICHPNEFDFYLCSHAGIKGTSRPAHYHVIWDENNFSADNLQALTYDLCYTYARCTRSVSIVPPAYYAHLAAFRARFYMEHEDSDGGSLMGGGQSRASRQKNHDDSSVSAAAAVRPLPRVRRSVKQVMFYC